MLRSEAITIIKRGLGFRQTQDPAIIAALKQAQRDAELGQTLPSWLVTFDAPIVVSANATTATLPADFLRFHDEYPPYWVNSEGSKVFFPRKNAIEAGEAYGRSDSDYVQVFVLRNKTTIELVPPPTTDTTYYLTYYRAAAVLDSELENEWLKYAPNYLIGMAGVHVAGDVRDQAAAGKFNTMAKIGQRAMIGDIVEDELAGRPLIMGEEQLMGLEALTPSTFISGLTASWPTAGEPKSQGDDHLRLLKGVLQNTFPNATRPFAFPSTQTLTTNASLTAVGANNAIIYLNTATPFTVTLPALASGDAGFVVNFIKSTTDVGYAHIVPSSGSIISQVGTTPLIRIGQVCQLATFNWSGGGWYCSKSGGMIGEVISFDGPVQPGWLEPFVAPTGFSSTGTFCELFTVTGGVFPNRAGRVDACWDPGYGVVGNVIGAAVGSSAGTEVQYLTLFQLPSHQHGVNIRSGDDSPDHTHTYTEAYDNFVGVRWFDSHNEKAIRSANTGGASTRHQHNINGASDAAGGSSWHPYLQPTLMTRRLIRAC